MSAVRFAGVSKRFGAVEALAGLDLAIEKGEFVSLLGPSGSGKTTSLNLLAGLLAIDEGEIWIGARCVNGLSPDRRDVAMVFQNYALYPHMTVFENLAFPLRARKRRLAEDALTAKVRSVASTLGVDELLARYPRELSGGQQQRVALGRAMVRDPQVFLLDEPLSNLDARLRIRMRKDIKALHEALASTIVYVTHDQSEAMSMSTRIAVFDHGRLQQYGTPAAIYNRPDNLFVANFVGEREINRIEGRVDEREGKITFSGPGFSAPIGASSGPLAAYVGRRAVLAVRPEGVVTTDAGNGVPARVVLTELSGPDQIVYAVAGEGIELCCRVDPASPVAKGDAVRIAFASDRVFLFDPDTTLALRATGH